jgi:hypothetical protein
MQTRAIARVLFLAAVFADESCERCAVIGICVFRKPGLSADDRRIAVLNTAFWAVDVFCGVKSCDYV